MVIDADVSPDEKAISDMDSKMRVGLTVLIETVEGLASFSGKKMVFHQIKCYLCKTE